MLDSIFCGLKLQFSGKYKDHHQDSIEWQSSAGFFSAAFSRFEIQKKNHLSNNEGPTENKPATTTTATTSSDTTKCTGDLWRGNRKNFQYSNFYIFLLIYIFCLCFFFFGRQSRRQNKKKQNCSKCRPMSFYTKKKELQNWKTTKRRQQAIYFELIVF